MKTDELVAVLAMQASPIDPDRTARRFRNRLAAAALPAFALVLLLLGPRPDLAPAAGQPMFWLKLAVPAATALGAALLLFRLGLPGERLRRAPAAIATPLAAVWVLGAAALLAAPAGSRLPMWLGTTWLECPLLIAAFSLPAFALALLAVRQLAPTQLPLAGAAAGLFGGAVAALAYALHCPETGVPFLATWYVLGMLLPAGLGALLGRRLLRW